MPTENSLSPPPKSPTGPACIPLSNDSGQKRKKEKEYVPNLGILACWESHTVQRKY